MEMIQQLQGMPRGRLVLLCFSIICMMIAALPQAQGQCVYPPGLWCSDPTISRACKVEEQCHGWDLEVISAQPVDLGLYYESLCPGCREFILHQLYPAWKKLGSDVINITLVPYGNAEEKFVDNEWVFTCQHGVNECKGNLLETCTLNISSDFSAAFKTIHCMESSTGDPFTIAQKCCSQFNVDYNKVSSCANSSLGNRLEHDMALKTGALDPPHEYTPWITLNGVHTEDIQTKAEDDLLSLICATYQGKPPPACQSIISQKRCLRD